MYVIKKDSPKPFDGFSLKNKKASSATKTGAEFTIIVAFDTDVMFMLQCHKIKSIVNANDAIAVNKIVFELFT